MKLFRICMLGINQYVISLLLISTYLLVSPLYASERKDSFANVVNITDYEKSSFNPVNDKSFIIPVRINDDQNIKTVEIDILTHDDDLVKKLSFKDVQPKNKLYPLSWDGRDSEKRLVPNEAYYPVLVITDKNGELTRVDPRDYSGGEEVYDFEKNTVPKSIEYTLPVDSRMLVRSGIKNGPMLRTIIDWEPRTKGFPCRTLEWT